MTTMVKNTSSSVFVVAMVIVLLALTVDALGQAFVPGCTLPFDAIKEDHPLDQTCGPEGTTPDQKNRAQNRAKNNFCASNQPANVTFTTFRKLQQVAEQQDIPFGSHNKLPADRSTLQDLHTTTDGKKVGEGTRVRLVAFVSDAHHSNVSKGETVNCKKGGQENNDIHVALVRTKGEDDLCNSITAEISPHFRPAAWEEITHRDFSKRPLRLTGHLFFDASHVPCNPPKRASPARFSIWEIHPVYAMDVCKNTTLPNCKVDRESDWIAFDEWVGIDSDDDDEH